MKRRRQVELNNNPPYPNNDRDIQLLREKQLTEEIATKMRHRFIEHDHKVLFDTFILMGEELEKSPPSHHQYHLLKANTPRSVQDNSTQTNFLLDEYIPHSTDYKFIHQKPTKENHLPSTALSTTMFP